MGGTMSSVNTEAGMCPFTSEISRSKSYFTWTFEGVESELGGAFISPLFTAGPKLDHTFSVRAYPKGRSVDDQDYLSLYIELVSAPKELRHSWLKFSFHFLDIDGHMAFPLGTKKPYKFSQGKDWGFKRFLKRDILLDDNYGLIKDGNITIVSVIEILEDPCRKSNPGNDAIISSKKNSELAVGPEDRGAVIVLVIYASLLMYQRFVTYAP